MTPGRTLDSRVADLERDVATMAQRIKAVEDLVHTLAPLATQTAVMAVHVKDLDDDVRRVEKKFDGRLDRIEQLVVEERRTREEIRERERKEAEMMRLDRVKEAATGRRWAIGLAVVILLGLIGTAAQLSGIGG